ncbi:concanavalin A-like lectin/glucanase [Sodiomyces alkalinus F11]|uniref:Concanavalin A-like lectin/glucanase n=1 Tax=Sodiomyces alkalinus (strain CBS 110278 / VKM F-3762 / F11) TaxID=1314773 RepID=A0A3N2Q590_SODAK|nr:concanavalin A-like lectin/glucanase [Sodiomyces alkalinus F11]ROT41944.1 concanavalin A-like lectin/glucanase [Sodiomyces alkalinus F11]
MGLNCRWLVNAGLLALPIAITLAVLFGLQAGREAVGKPPLFVDNGIKRTQYCQKAFGIHPESRGLEYTLNPNQWGWSEGEPGGLCINVTSFNNQTYATKSTAPEFSVTWEYPPGPLTQPVHAFPNIKVESTEFPVRVRDLESISIDVEWTYGVGNRTASTTDEDELAEHEVNTNVAIDMFLDSNKKKAKDSTKASYELMVWLAAIGPATHPIGLKQGAMATEIINGITFSLYVGRNSLKQNVLTWVASETVEKFNADLTPLVQRVLSGTGSYYPLDSDYVGYMGLGSEAYHSNTAVTFHVPQLAIDVQRSS